MIAPSDRYRDLYRHMYTSGTVRVWRDLGAIDKGSNILRIWAGRDTQAKPRVVEIGCGEGAIADYLGRVNFFEEYKGFDLSPSGVATARQREVPRATCDEVDDARIPLADDTADLVILSHVVEHLEYPRRLIYEAARLDPWVIVEVPLELNARFGSWSKRAGWKSCIR